MTIDFFSYPTNKKILIVDDEEPMRELLQLYLTAEGFETDSAIDGEEAIRRLKAGTYDLILLDLMMPKMDGLDVCKWIRQVSTVPIIMLTARDETIDKVVGLKIGADDYLTKPFDRAELMARIHSLFRRGNLKPRDETPERPIRKAVLTHEALHLNMQNHQVFYRDRELLLTPKEYALLKLFLSNKERIFQREDILELLWKNRTINDDRTVDTHLKNLRDKLTQAGIPGHQVIKTVWGTGFICHEDT